MLFSLELIPFFPYKVCFHVRCLDGETFSGFRSEQFFGTPSDTATAAEGVRERLLLVEERRLQLQEARLHTCDGGEEKDMPNGQEGRLDVIGEELSEKEEGEEETE